MNNRIERKLNKLVDTGLVKVKGEVNYRSVYVEVIGVLKRKLSLYYIRTGNSEVTFPIKQVKEIKYHKAIDDSDYSYYSIILKEY